MLHAIGWIPLIPLFGVVVNGLFGRRLPRQLVGGIACAVVLAALIVSAGAVFELSRLPVEERFQRVDFGNWMVFPGVGGSAPLTVSWSFALDPLSAVLLLVVTGVGFLIHVYSVGYMAHEEGASRFFTYLNLFISMMLVLVLGSNLMVMFVGWEGVGLCSYLLIGYFYDRPFDERTGLSCADAGRKAFLTNRIGDFAFLIGVLYLITAFGTVEFRELASAVTGGGGSQALLLGVGLLLFFGAAGKSAQIPLYVWLPDAMAGPTPVSALIHAATMVTAGVYMVCRMWPVYTAAPEAMGVVAGVGAATALFAASMGLAATDIKKVLAYSTVSQLGYMFAGAGVGGGVAAVFHLMTHAFFKALLFLGAGSVIHGMSGEQDIRRMGGLRGKLPVTFWTFIAATAALCGIPGLAGFFSKDEILWRAWSSGHRWIWAVLALAAAVTAFYMVRLVWLVFFGAFRGTDEQAHHLHEAPKSMTVPLIVLAVLSVAGGWIGIPAALTGKSPAFERWLEPVFASTDASEAGRSARARAEGGSHAGSEGAHGAANSELGLMGLAVGFAAAGIFGAAAVYRQPGRADRLATALGPAYKLVRNLYWVDELYEFVFLKPFRTACDAAQALDVSVVDGAVRGVRNVTIGLSYISSVADDWIVDGLVRGAGAAVRECSKILRLLQTGRVQNYAAVMVFGMFVLMVMYTFAR